MMYYLWLQSYGLHKRLSVIGLVHVAKILIDHGAEPNKADRGGRTPLCLAAEHGFTGLVQFLLEKGADPNVEGG